jgi:hypothetical protein
MELIALLSIGILLAAIASSLNSYDSSKHNKNYIFCECGWKGTSEDLIFCDQSWIDPHYGWLNKNWYCPKCGKHIK